MMIDDDDDNDGHMIFVDLGGEENPERTLTQGTCPDRGSNPGPLHDRRSCYRLAHSSGYSSEEITMLPY